MSFNTRKRQRELKPLGNCCDTPHFTWMEYYWECVVCECCCKDSGQDDGGKTCWQHHDCYNSDCTHQDNDPEDF